MESNENQPLKHLLSLEWGESIDTSLTKYTEQEDKPPKQKKKVRFSDKVEQTYLDTNDPESNLTDSENEDDVLSQDEEFSIYEDDFNEDEENESKESESNELEFDKNLSQSEELSNESISESKGSNELELDKHLLQSEELSNERISESKDSNELKVDKNLSQLEELSNENVNESKESNKLELEKRLLQSEELSNEKISESKECNKLELDNNFSQSEKLSNENIVDIQKSSSDTRLVTNLEELDSEVEKQILEFSCQVKTDKSMKITSDDKDKLDLTTTDVYDLCDSKTETVLFEAISSEKKNYKCNKRFLQKQSEKMNELLKNTDLTSSNALQIKQAVWEAWSTVKKWEYITTKREMEWTKINEEKSKSISIKAKSDHQPQALWKRTSGKKKKLNLTNFNQLNKQSSIKKEMSKAEKEEIEMAFKSWKKQKEEILKQNAIKQQSEKQQKRMAALMDEEMKKERAKSAFIEWKMNKISINKKEKDMKAWFMEKEKEVNDQKLQRDKEAQEIFHKWLETKHFQTDIHSMILDERPPWFPPG